MGTLRGYSVNTPVIFEGTIRQRTVGSSAHYKENQPRFRCKPLKRWQTQNARYSGNELGNIRNRDHSVHRLSAVRALNLHRRRSTCVLLTSVGCKRS